MREKNGPDHALSEEMGGPFRTASTEWLRQVGAGEIDARAESLKELANRGLSPDGEWVGFGDAERLAREAIQKLPSARRKGEIGR